MSLQQLAQPTERHQVTILPPSDPRFRNLDRLILQLEEQPRQPRKAVLQLRRRWIERNIPVYTLQQQIEVPS